MRRMALRPLTAVGIVALAAMLPGCREKDSPGDAANGKQLFVSKCGSCHTLARAGSKGTTGPNLDDAFRQDRSDGIPRDSIRGLVNQQILYPNKAGQMPPKLVRGSDAWDVATYVAQSVDRPGEDTGLLASIGAATKKTKATEQGGKLQIPADPTGQLAYLVSSATARAGRLTLLSQNKSSTPHDISVQGPGTNKSGPVVQNGKVSTLTVALKPGKYTFYCSVPGHRQAGMQGPLVVK